MAYPWIRLFYTITRTHDKMDYRIRLTTTSPYFGGLRWWYICPLSVNGRSCHRRIGKLYLPNYARFYGCRHCYELTYRSCQEADKRVYWLRHNPETDHGTPPSKFLQHLIVQADVRVLPIMSMVFISSSGGNPSQGLGILLTENSVHD
jgi:hypothetical protein